MEVSIFLAKILGPICVAIGLGALFNPKSYQKMIEDVMNNAALLYLGGFLALLFGLLIVLSHNVWVASWVVIITVFGWLSLIKGVLLLVCPGAMVKMSGGFRKNSSALIIHAVIVIAIGAFLCYMGYVV